MRYIVATFCVLMLSACAPEPGSEKWCAKLKEKPKAEWTGEEAKTYAQSCVL